MNEEFKELFSNLSEKDQKEVANLIRFKNEVKYHDKQFEELLQQYIELSREYDKLQNNWNELKEWLEEIESYFTDEYKSTKSDLVYRYYKGARNAIGDTLTKMQEIEGGVDNDK